MPRRSSRDEILDALQRILIESGLHAVTLDAVAKSAGVSKGGLLYHFPSKEALITAFAQRLAVDIDAEFAQAEKSDDIIGFFLRASVPSSSERALYWSLVAALHTKDVASEEARDLIVYCFARWKEILHKHIDDPATAEIVRLVGDGLYLSALAGLPLPDPKLMELVRTRLADPPA